MNNGPQVFKTYNHANLQDVMFSTEITYGAFASLNLRKYWQISDISIWNFIEMLTNGLVRPLVLNKRTLMISCTEDLYINQSSFKNVVPDKISMNICC